MQQKQCTRDPVPREGPALAHVMTLRMRASLAAATLAARSSADSPSSRSATAPAAASRTTAAATGERLVGQESEGHGQAGRAGQALG